MDNPMQKWQRITLTITMMALCVSPAFGLDAIEAAHEHFHERRYAEAVQAYHALLETELRQSQRDNIRLMLGQSYAKLGEDAEARRVFKEIIDENPNGSYATQAVHRLGNLYIQRYQFREAILHCKQMLKQHPNTPAAATAAYLIAQYEYAAGQHENAMASYQYFLDTYPRSPYGFSAVNSLIQLYIENKRYAAAEKLIAAQMEKNPGDTTLVEKLAALYQQQGAQPKALALYRNALEQQPGNTSLRRKLGTLYVELGKTQQAVEEWKRLVAGETNSAERQQELGALYLSHKMYPEAIAAYRQAIRFNPQYGYLYTQLASAYKIQGQLEEAGMVYLQALQNVGMVHNQRDAILFAMQDIYDNETQKPLMAKLIAHTQKSVKQQPQNANLTLTAAELLFYDGQHQEALKTFTQLHARYPAYMDITLAQYARILERNGNPTAVDFYQTLMQISDDKARLGETQRKLARLYHKMARWTDAVELLTTDANAALPGANATETQLLLAQMQLHGLRNPTAAYATFQRLLTRRLVGSQLTAAQLGAAECHLLLERYPQAQEMLAPIAESANRFRTTALKLLGDAYFFNADFERAAEAYKQALLASKSERLTNDALERIVLIQAHPDYLKIPLAEYATAVRLYQRGDTDAAVQQCERTVEVYPQALIVDDLWLLLGDIYRKEGKDAAAIAAYQRITSPVGETPRPDSPHSALAAKALMHIAEIYQRRADDANAIATYTALITGYPEDVLTVYARQQLNKLAKKQQN